MLNGLFATLQWQSFSMILIGVPIGLLLGALPGLGGMLGLALMIPFVLGMNPVSGFALLLSMHAVTHTAGVVPSILFNTPGTAPTAVTCFDGHPLAKQGRAGEAFGASFTASGLGGVIGAVIMMILIPIARPLLISFGPPELFMLGALGITFISTISGKNQIKGLIVGGLGVMMSFIGREGTTGIIRYGGGLLYLRDGLPIVPIVMGIFAIAEVIDLLVKQTKSVAEGASEDIKVGDDVWKGVLICLKKWPLVLRVGILGTIVGIMPGLGAEAAGYLAYGHASQISKGPVPFGQGNIEGVIAPDTTSNSKEGGALLTTISLGIPGSSGMAVLLGAFVVMGLVPGPNLMIEQPTLVWSLVWVLVFANLIAALSLLLCSKHLAKLTRIKMTRIIPFVLVFAMLGSFLTTSQIQNIFLTALMGVIGYFLKKYKFHRAPILLGFVLGRIVEARLLLSLTLFGWSFVTRPLTAVLLALTILSLVHPVWKRHRERKKLRASAG